jgi:translation initiation factor 2D
VIKNPSFKKLKPFLKSMQKDGLLKLKEMGGELNVMVIDLTHPELGGVEKYRTVADDEKRDERAKAAAELESSGSKMMVITKHYKPNGPIRAL